MNYIIESLDYNLKSLEDLFKKKITIESNNKIIQENISKLELEILESKESKNYYSIVVNEIYETRVKALKDTLDTALKYIVFDRNLSSELILEDKRGTKTLSISIIDNDEGYEVDVKEGTGMGIATIISAVLKLYYLSIRNSKILLLDEKYSNVSIEYTQKFFEFFKEVVKEKDMVLVLITHDNRFQEYGDVTYQVSQGNVVKLINNKNKCGYLE